MIYERKPELTNQEASDMALCAMAMREYIKELDTQRTVGIELRKIGAAIMYIASVIGMLRVLYSVTRTILGG